MASSIAIVGLACEYPDARSPIELWDNVLAQRRAFRRIPAGRLRAEDYLAADSHAPDKTYVAEAAVIEGYEFDRVGFRVAGSTYRSADLAHWLALDVASRALADAGFANAAGVPRESTGVVLGNTLTGEFSRANLMRLRWPYVKRVLSAALAKEDWPAGRRAEFLSRIEEEYKEPFPPVGEETLAGGLSNTIAGRICNQFDFKGGGYTVDGACASSLLAVANACSALAAGDLDVALAGGVDLSLDPFEIVGFAKTGALAPELMRVFDARSAGFWPGEGCGFAVLMRHDDATASGRRIYAVLRGWGISSDGNGGITRPEADGQRHALNRAYARANYGIDSVACFEGHGTGTAVGDATELSVLSRARHEARAGAPAAAIGSIKANIGHTKAAAGIAGLIKAAMAVHTQTLPPTTGCERPQAALLCPAAPLRVLREPEPWPDDVPLRAAVSAMGFGGINSHVTLESPLESRQAARRALGARERLLAGSAQDVELFLIEGVDRRELLDRVETLLSFAARLSRAELADLATELIRRRAAEDKLRLPRRSFSEGGWVRAAIVAAAPAECAGKLETLRSWLTDGIIERVDVEAGIFIGYGGRADVPDPTIQRFNDLTSRGPRIGFLFPGQASPANLDGGIYCRRFATVRELYATAALPRDADAVSTAVAQPGIVTASIAALRVLHDLQIRAVVAVGHSLGELVALHWAGAIDEPALLRVARERGRAMAELGSPTGAMSALAAPADMVRPLLAGAEAEIVGFNSPRQTVIAGQSRAVSTVMARAVAQGIRATRLAVSHAFHTPLVAAAAPALAAQLAREEFRRPSQRVFSTITGAELPPDQDLRALLCRQVTSPVEFMEAVTAANCGVDLWLEVGPGEILAGLAGDSVATPVIALDAGGESLRGLWRAVGAAFVLGAPVDVEALGRDRFAKPFNLDWRPKFFTNPCELAPTMADDEPCIRANVGSQQAQRDSTIKPFNDSTSPASALETFRQLVAARAELPVSAVTAESRLLADLHLNSITVGQLVAETARRLGLPPLVGITDFANQTVGRAAAALDELTRGRGVAADPIKQPPAGVDAWVRPFVFDWVPAPLDARAELARRNVSRSDMAGWQVIAAESHPLFDSVRQAAQQLPGAGVIVLLPEKGAYPRPFDAGSTISLLLEGGRTALRDGASRFVLVQHGFGAGAFARTLHLESPSISTCVIDVPFSHSEAAPWIADEAVACHGHVDVRYDRHGRRYELVMRPLPLEPSQRDLPLGPDDVLLVSGDGKGIATECALALARKTGARLVLLGRSQSTDAEVAANLERIAAHGIACRYFSADVTDAAAVRSAIARAEDEVGRVTAVLHAAGANVPQPIATLDEASFRRTVAPKVSGLENVLGAVDGDRLRLLVTFGSIIGRAGFHGEADYAVANEWLTGLTEEFQAAHPKCRCLAAEWSVWSGVGMGARLGRIESLRQQGVAPITPEAGVEILEQLLRRDLPGTAVVIASRFGELPTLKLEKPELPFLRFLEQPRVYFPGIELVADSTISAESDPYVQEHVFHGEALLPAVVGLEAMAQAAIALTGTQEPPSFEQVEFARPVVIARGEKTTIRVAALVREPGVVEVALRCEQTGFQTDHFRAVCRFVNRAAVLRESKCDLPGSGLANRVALNPSSDLYDRLLFHSGRFRRVQNYRLLRARECAAQLQPYIGAPWFARYLPQTCALGCAAVRDAAIHAIQACIPHARLLPVGVGRIVTGDVPCLAAGSTPPDCLPELLLHARETRREGDIFHYDVALRDGSGALLELWHDLRLQKVEDLRTGVPWPEPLLAALLERRAEELISNGRLSVILARGVTGEEAIRQACGAEVAVRDRSDGKPEVAGQTVSVSRTGDVTLAVSGTTGAGCDVETVASRPADAWRALLGAERFALAEIMARDEDFDTAATRVWTAIEATKKGGVTGTPLVLSAPHRDGWVVLGAGSRRIATWAGSVQDRRIAVGILG